MSKPQVSVTISPSNSGQAPFTINVTLDSVTLSEEMDLVSVAHIGNTQEDTVINPEHQAHLGYQLVGDDYTYYWGTNGKIFNTTELDYTYTGIGHYIVTLYLTFNGELYTYPYDIFVYGLPFDYDDDFNLLQKYEQECFRFATDTDQGYGWMEIGGDEWIWPDAPGSELQFFHNANQVNIIYDRYSGLPYIIDNRKQDGFLEVTYKHKVDLKIDDSGTDIDTYFLPEEIRASLENYYIEPSDLWVKIFGLDGGSLLSGFECDLKLYIDRAVDYTSELTNIPFDRELYFSDGKSKQGQKLRLLFETNKSKYLFERFIWFLKVTEKMVALLKGETEIETKQCSWLNVSAWYSKPDYTIERVYQNSSPFLAADIVGSVIGVDGEADSAIEINEAIFQFPARKKANLTTDNEVWVWSTVTSALSSPGGTIVEETIGTVDVGGTIWYLLKIQFGLFNQNDDVTFKAGKYYDLRFLPENEIIDDYVSYYVAESQRDTDLTVF